MELSQSKEQAEAALQIISTDSLCSVDLFSLYEDGGMTGLFANCSDKPRLFVHLALAALKKNNIITAMGMLEKIPEEVYDSPTAPAHHDEFLQSTNARIILQVEEGDLGGALYELQRRSELISEWIGSKSVELARNLYVYLCT